MASAELKKPRGPAVADWRGGGRSRDHPAGQRAQGRGERGPRTWRARRVNTQSSDSGLGSREAARGSEDTLPPSGPGACLAFGLELLLRVFISSFSPNAGPAEGQAQASPFSQVKQPPSIPSSVLGSICTDRPMASGWGEQRGLFLPLPLLEWTC